MQCHITKQLVHSFLVNIRISQPSKVMFTSVELTNLDVNLKRMHQFYNVGKSCTSRNFFKMKNMTFNTIHKNKIQENKILTKIFEFTVCTRWHQHVISLCL